MANSETAQKKLGLLIGGSGLIGGYLLHYFKNKTPEIDLRSPNSKKLSLRELDDIISYFKRQKPAFVINTAITTLRSDALLSYEVNYLGSINLAKVAMALNIPYIHFSSAATLPMGENLTEEEHRPLTASLPYYPRSKLMAEMTLKHLVETKGLDCTIIRLGIVYGKHDHKIQGFHRMLFSVVNEAMMFMLTKPGVMHSYSNTKKIPSFVHYVLENRDEFSGETYHFVDRNPVELSQLILTIKSYLELKRPKEIYIPYPLARFSKTILGFLLKRLSRLGLEARMPKELMFLEYFFKTQVLSSEKLQKSSYGDPDVDKTIFTELPDIIKYYQTRWKLFNLLTGPKGKTREVADGVAFFKNDPQNLIKDAHRREVDYFTDYNSLRE